MIECYVSLCENHIVHTFGPNEGPFCNLDACTKSCKEIALLLQEERARKQAPVDSNADS